MSSAQTAEREFSTGAVHLPEPIKAFFESGFKIKIKGDNGEGIVYAGKPSWFPEVENKMRKFLELEKNWDSYGASPIDEELVVDAFNLLFQSNDIERVGKPLVIPRKDGGINLEWDVRGRFLSVEVKKEGNEYFLFDRPTGKKTEQRLDDDLDSILHLIM